MVSMVASGGSSSCAERSPASAVGGTGGVKGWRYVVARVEGAADGGLIGNGRVVGEGRYSDGGGRSGADRKGVKTKIPPPGMKRLSVWEGAATRGAPPPDGGGCGGDTSVERDADSYLCVRTQ